MYSFDLGSISTISHACPSVTSLCHGHRGACSILCSCLSDAHRQMLRPAAVTNCRLQDVISHSNMAGKNLVKVRNVATCITEVLGGITDAGVIHGDVKPRNFVMMKNGNYAAIDLDAAVVLNGESEAGQKKTSSGCLPPEQARVEYHRRIHGDGAPDGPEAVIARTSYDMWQVYSFPMPPNSRVHAHADLSLTTLPAPAHD